MKEAWASMGESGLLADFRPTKGIVFKQSLKHTTQFLGGPKWADQVLT
jgi:hypothetical protein